MLWNVNTALKNISLILRRLVLLVKKKEYPEYNIKIIKFVGDLPLNDSFFPGTPFSLPIKLIAAK
jgi:hypothetical protein